MSHAIRGAAALAVVVLVASVAGCGHRLQKVLLPETRPEIKLGHVRLAPPSDKTYAYLARWSGSAPGTQAVHYVYAIDPMSVDRVDATWVSTNATEHVLSFALADGKAQRRPHVFAIRAVSGSGTMSDPAWFAFTQDNLPPVVQITNPVPNPNFVPTVSPTVTFSWQGTDPDGQPPLPVRYTFRLFNQYNPDYPQIGNWITFALTYPDSVRALYAPDFPGWTSVSRETTSFQYANLNPGSTYLFMITAFDEAGDYDPVFSANKNMCSVAVVFSGTIGPFLTMFNQFFNYTYPVGGYYNDAAHTVRVEMPAGQPATVNWVATPMQGSSIQWYRWALGMVDLTDETPRVNEATDLHHWSARGLNVTSATLPPVNPPPGRTLTEFLYIEAQDTNGLRSLGIVELVFQRPAFNEDLLFVDDTRLRPDFESSPGQLEPPAGPWPTAAELDTFLYARGGNPWRGYPAGTVSPPGIFNGYAYDTLGTRGFPGGVPPLSLLAGYRHVVWYTDEAGVTYTASPTDPTAPITALRLMNSPGMPNTLAAYIGQGGKVWLCGDGAAYATLISWNRNNTSPLEYTAANGELVPGRFMYDFSHWREGIEMLPAVNARKFGSTSFGLGDNRPGRQWPPSPPPPTPPSPPDYTLLPANLDPKNVATDPPPPLRPADSFWLRGTYNAEVIHLPTLIREDYNDDPNVVEEYSTLDTLYICRGGTAPANAPVMTYYHGRENQPFVFSGFNFWYWRRTECIQLVDWVLQSVWGLPRDPGAPRTPGAVPLAAGAHVSGSRTAVTSPARSPGVARE